MTDMNGPGTRSRALQCCDDQAECRLRYCTHCSIWKYAARPQNLHNVFPLEIFFIDACILLGSKTNLASNFSGRWTRSLKVDIDWVTVVIQPRTYVLDVPPSETCIRLPNSGLEIFSQSFDSVIQYHLTSKG
jgi:hypothetical protein